MPYSFAMPMSQLRDGSAASMARYSSQASLSQSSSFAPATETLITPTRYGSGSTSIILRPKKSTGPMLLVSRQMGGTAVYQWFRSRWKRGMSTAAMNWKRGSLKSLSCSAGRAPASMLDWPKQR